VPLLVANPNRRGLLLFNSSTQILYVKYGLTASATDYSFQIAAGGTFQAVGAIYLGAMDGIWASANGSVKITELSE
jgi:hypothetical protein